MRRAVLVLAVVAMLFGLGAGAACADHPVYVGGHGVWGPSFHGHHGPYHHGFHGPVVVRPVRPVIVVPAYPPIYGGYGYPGYTGLGIQYYGRGFGVSIGF